MLILASTVVLFVILSCKDTIAPTTSDIVFPSSNVTYTQHVGPLFQQTCALSGCHTQNGIDPNLEYPASYTSLLDYIRIGDPEHSTLVQYLEGTLQPQMPPPGKATLTKNQIDGIKTWIREGATPK